MDKKKLIETMKASLEEDLRVLKEAAQAAFEAATHEENKPENEYDTRSVEASYLAAAQAKRVMEIEEIVSMFKYLEPKKFGAKDPISATALVQVELNDKKSFLFILPKGGGVSISFEGKTIQVVTPHSPLGQVLVGLKAGDSAFAEANNSAKEYIVLSVE